MHQGVGIAARSPLGEAVPQLNVTQASPLLRPSSALLHLAGPARHTSGLLSGKIRGPLRPPQVFQLNIALILREGRRSAARRAQVIRDRTI